MVYIKKFKRNRPQNLRGVMRPNSLLEQSLGHPRVRRTLMRALVGHPMSVTPYEIIALERLRAASRTTRRLTQEDYEEQGLSYQAQLERDAMSTTESDATESDATESDATESDSDESFGLGWVWNQRARALGDLTNDQRYYRDDTASRWYG